jgi:hypothetical protein
VNRHKSFFTGCILLFVVLFGCSKDDRNQWQLAADEYVFVEFSTYIYANIIEGEKYTFDAIAYPRYLFDKETNELFFYEHEYGDFNFEALKLIKGSGRVMTGGAGVSGGGAANGLGDYYDIPTEHLRYPVKKLHEDGTIELDYNGSGIIALSAREAFVNAITEIDSQLYYDGNLDTILTAIAEITTTYTITNYGILKKSGIKFIQ